MTLLALGLGFISAIITNSFIRRPHPNYGYCIQIQEQNPRLDCSQKATESRGWPFPTKFIVKNGAEKTIQTDTSGYCIGGCGLASIGGQFTYNALLLSLVYFAMIALVIKIRH